MAHGIYPPVLAWPAWRRRCGRSSTPGCQSSSPRCRDELLPGDGRGRGLPPVAEAVDDAVRGGATSVTATVRCESDDLVVEVHALEATGRGSELVHVADRLGAV